MWSNWEKEVKPDAQIPKKLFWDVDLNNFDLQKGRAFIAERVAERGDLPDFNVMFLLYGGIDGVREIYKNEVKELNPRALSFITAAFNLKKNEMKCCTQKRLKKIHWNY